MKINKMFPLIAVVGLSAIVFGGCLKKDNTKPTDNPEEIATMMEAGKPMYCVMSTSEGGTIETWTKGEKTKVYGDNMGGGMGKGYMITDDEWTYIWVEGETKGSKYAVIDEETPRSEGEDFEDEMPEFDMQQELEEHQVADYEYECNEQDIPDSTFIPPTGIEFVDVMENMGGGFQDFKQM